MRLKGRRILIGVTGGISVYKICELVRLLIKANLEVKVIMTESATKFIAPETFRVLSRNEVLLDVFEYSQPSRVEHIALAEEADLFIIAPATANTLAKMAHGIADNLLTCCYLAFKGPVLVCPAMNSRMYSHPTTQRNLKVLKENGVHILEPESGSLACGAEGKGRLPEPETIFEAAIQLLSIDDLKGVKVAITAGPTREHIDPVRFISNPSSGKMGFALAKAAKRRKAQVTLITGPTWLETPLGVKRVDVVSAQQMYQEVMKIADETDVFIMSAAVADYTPKSFSEKKIKKEEGISCIELERTPDIAEAVGKRKRRNQILVGFAAETHDVIENAMNKLKKKNMDMIVANTTTEAFQKDTNKVMLIDKEGNIRYLPEMPKEDVADEILDEIALMLEKLHMQTT